MNEAVRTLGKLTLFGTNKNLLLSDTDYEIMGRCYLSKWTIYMVSLTVLGAFSSSFMVVLGEDFTSIIYTPQDSPLGIAFGDWIKTFWNWWANVPEPNTSSTCFFHDTGNAIFLADPLKVGSKTYSCNIPTGKPIFFPLVSSEFDKGESTNKDKTGNELMDAAKRENGGQYEPSLTLRLDGKIIDPKFLVSLRAQAPLWNITILEGNQYGEPHGTYLAAAEGWYVFLKPLPLGSHELTYVATSPKPEGSMSSGDVTYKLLVNSSAP